MTEQNGSLQQICAQARALIREARFEEAHSLVTQAIAMDANCVEAYEIRTNLNIMHAYAPELAADLQELIRLRPGDARLHFRHGKALAMLRRFDEAVGEFSKALRLDPSCKEVLFHRMAALSKSGQHLQAEEEYGKWQALMQSPEAREASLAEEALDNARTALARGDANGAVKACEDALRHKPGYSAALDLRGRAYSQRGDHTLACSDLISALDQLHEASRTQCGFLVCIEDTHHQKHPFALLPETREGRAAATQLLEELVQTQSDAQSASGVRCSYLYRLQGSAVELMDYVWNKAVEPEQPDYTVGWAPSHPAPTPEQLAEIRDVDLTT